MTPFPWREAIAFGLGVLKFPPDVFWRMTPRELAFAIRGARGDIAPPITRGDFNALMRAYSDEATDGR